MDINFIKIVVIIIKQNSVIYDVLKFIGLINVLIIVKMISIIKFKIDIIIIGVVVEILNNLVIKKLFI